jgi:hypothetical protein
MPGAPVKAVVLASTSAEWDDDHAAAQWNTLV